MIKYIAFADSPYALTLINDQTQQLALEDVYVVVDSSEGAVQIILPLTTDFPVQNLCIFVQDKTGDAATNAIVITAQGSDLINGGENFTINTAYGFARIQIGAEGLYTVTTANPPGGGGDLWRFNATSPGTNIELNTAQGVTGIDAPSPNMPRLRLILSNVLGFDAGGFIYDTAQKVVSAGVTIVSGNEISSLFARNKTNSTQAEKRVEIDAITGRANSYDLVSFNAEANREKNEYDIHERRVTDGTFADTLHQQNINSFLNIARDIAANDYTVESAVSTAKEISIYKAGIEIVRLRFEDGGLKVVDPVAGDMFRVDQTGKIYSNQTSAAGAPGAITDKLPLYAPNGLLVGYVPVYDSL